MARTATRKQIKPASKKPGKNSAQKLAKKLAKKPAARPIARKKAATATRNGGRSKPAQVIERKGMAAKAAAAAHEGVFHKMLGRIKPLFRKPLDPRVRHMVEVFGEQAVKNLIAAFRESRDTAGAELNDALERAEAMQPPPAHGTFVWHELMTRDVPGASRFYEELFGWSRRDVEMMPGFNYTLMRQISKDLAGLVAITPEQGDVQPGWVVYVHVDDVDAAAEKTESLGGEVVVPPHDIPVGRWAMIKDPGGATICVYRAHG